MILAVTNHFLLDPSIATGTIAAMALLAVGAWVLLHILPPMAWRQGAWRRAAWLAGGTGAGVLAMLAAFQLVQRIVTLATSWPLWALAVMGALLAEAIVALYDYRPRGATRGAMRAMAALRVTLAMTIVAMLAQPVIVYRGSKPAKKQLTILVDTSGSMQLPETQWTAGQKLRMAAVSDGAGRSGGLGAGRWALESARVELARRNEWLAELDGTDLDQRRGKWASGYPPMRNALEQAEKTLAEQEQAVGQAAGAAKLDAAGTAKLTNVRSYLATARRAVTDGRRATAGPEAAELSANHNRLRKALSDAAGGLRLACSDLEALQDSLDEAQYKALPAEKRKQIDRTSGKTRFELAKDVLRAPAPGGVEKGLPLLEALSNEFKLTIYTFNAACQEASVEEFLQDAPAATTRMRPGATTNPAEFPDAFGRTDLTGALQTAARAGGAAESAGLVVLSDFVHNATPIRPTGVLLAERKTPIFSVLIGSTKPPRDAAVLDVEAPESIHVGDKVLARAQLKFDGLAGRTAKVKLLDGPEVVDTRDVRVPTDRYRCTVELGHQPEAKGRRDYRVEIEPFEAELIETNNRFALSVNVSDERTNLLIVEDRPRWEFRYLKNLFTGRDNAVGLQYVLFRPDRIDADAARALPVIPAAAGRPAGQFQATALPANAQEWNKFDVVLLGDVPPEELGAQNLAVLRKFIVDRGGTLIVIAGPSYMPGSYTDTPLKDLLPVTFAPDPPAPGPENVGGFTFALTAEGLDSVVTHQHVDPERSRGIWQSFPPMYWRRGGVAARPAATVLAYARPVLAAPLFLQDAAMAQVLGDEAAALRQEQVRDYQRKNPLIAVHTVGAGRVMFLATDHTWRMRYGVGDRYHHQFWGQVLRWAATTKLSGGGRFARIGTPQSRYSPGQTVRVTARLLKADFTPMVTDAVKADLYLGEKLIDSRKLTASADGPDLYRGRFAPRGGGTYRLVLNAPAMDALIRQDGLDKVTCEFSVESPVPPEQAELAADRSLAASLADETGGQLLEASQASLLTELLKQENEQVRRERQVGLWDTWPLLAVMLAAVTAEWLLRKRAGLA